MSIQPAIAESWEYRDDCTVAFTIRKDITFSDGTPLTVEDVKFTIDRAIESPYVSYVVDFISKVETEGDSTVVVYTNEPFAPLLAHFSGNPEWLGFPVWAKLAHAPLISFSSLSIPSK